MLRLSAEEDKGMEEKVFRHLISFSNSGNTEVVPPDASTRRTLFKYFNYLIAACA